jgi:hypothetical protein
MVCGEDETPPPAVSDKCEHRLCTEWAYKLVTVAPFVDELRDHRHNMYRTGRCPFCRVPGVWTDRRTGIRIAHRMGDIIGYIEQNDTVKRKQKYQ